MITKMRYKLDFVKTPVRGAPDIEPDCFKLSIGNADNFVKFYTTNGIIDKIEARIERQFFDWALSPEAVNAHCKGRRFRMSYVDFIIEMIHPKLPKSGRIIAASSDAINAMCHYMTYSIEELNRQKRWNNNNLIWFFTSESEVLITESGEAVCQVVEKFKENMRSLDDEIFNIWVGKCIHSF